MPGFSTSSLKCGTFLTTRCIKDNVIGSITGSCVIEEPEPELVLGWFVFALNTIFLLISSLVMYRYFSHKNKAFEQTLRQTIKVCDLRREEAIRAETVHKTVKDLADRVSRGIKIESTPITLPADKMFMEFYRLDETSFDGFVTHDSLWKFFSTGKVGKISYSDFIALYTILEDKEKNDVDLLYFLYFISMAGDIIPPRHLVEFNRLELLVICADCLRQRSKQDHKRHMEHLRAQVMFTDVFTLRQKDKLNQRLCMIQEVFVEEREKDKVEKYGIAPQGEELLSWSDQISLSHEVNESLLLPSKVEESSDRRRSFVNSMSKLLSGDFTTSSENDAYEQYNLVGDGGDQEIILNIKSKTSEVSHLSESSHSEDDAYVSNMAIASIDDDSTATASSSNIEDHDSNEEDCDLESGNKNAFYLHTTIEDNDTRSSSMIHSSIGYKVVD